eukprot:7812413-Ditylum_brightwellii.AAC.1
MPMPIATLQSTSINPTDVIDPSNLPEVTVDTLTNVASTTAAVMARAFYPSSSAISDTLEEGSAETHLSDDEIKALVNKQYEDQLIKATKSSFSKLHKKVMPNK